MRTGLDAASLSRFRSLGALGSGGYGRVYEAIDERSGQHVAIKELEDVRANSIARFKQEFRALSDFHHPNLVSLKELIEEGGRWLIVMELVPGNDFLSYVRSGADNENAKVDQARLRKALLGMARGLVALHGHGVLHRDLKPSNVRVTPEGRAVLLDFGLATSVDPTRQSTHAMGLGTVAYMAPEQAGGQDVTEAVDWYALGVCLFEALTGQKPFDGLTPLQIVREKQQGTAPLASSLSASVPPELDALCARLLERVPAERATARDVLRVLEASETTEGPALELASAVVQVPFAGRESELMQLSHALGETQKGELRVVLVQGESGVGKSELVAEFVRRAQREQPALLALRGRCYENEHVSYKAFDGCIDELARVLRKMPDHACAQLLPPRAALLGQLFPVLRTIRAIARAPRGEQSADPTARRLEGFAALSALLRKLAEERPLVLVIDDLQWADAESFRLLLALVEQPEPPPYLVVATIRPHGELDDEVVAALDAIRRRHHIGIVQVLGLPLSQAEALAAQLLGPRVSARWLRGIAEESGGHPLFLTELVQFAQTRDPGAGPITLEAALRTRLERLDRDARALLDLVALAARPHGGHIFARALGVDDIAEPARKLLSAKILRLRKGQELGCYHDRIRHTAVALIGKSRLAALHKQLATALSTDPLADVSEQAMHWELAGELERAALAYERAADAALGALAFLHASQLTARARALGEQLGEPSSSERAQRLTVMQAHALACAGRAKEAAATFERASQQAHGEARLRLRARYAQQLVLSSEVELGFAEMRALLRGFGVTLPRSTAAMLASIAWYRLLLLFRGTRFKVRAARPGEELLVAAGDVVERFLQASGPLHPLVFMVITLASLRVTAALPRPEKVAQSLCALGWLRCLDGSLRAAQSLFARSRAVCEEVDDPLLLGKHEYAEGSARLLVHDWVGASACLERAHALLQAHCHDEPSLLTNARYHLGLAWYHRGQYARIAYELEIWIREARERGDSLSSGLLVGMGHGFVRHLMQDRPEDALRELEEAVACVPPAPFSFVHFGHFYGSVVTRLYIGGRAAHDWLERRSREHERALLLRSPTGKEALLVLRSYAALHAYESLAEAERAPLRARLRRYARRLARSSMKSHAHLVLSQLALLEERRELALAEAREALRLSAPSHYSAQTAAYAAALLETGDPDDPRCRAAAASLREQGWRRPERFLTLGVPALSSLARKAGTNSAALLLGRYEILGPLSRAGEGELVAARDVESGRSLVLKELVSKTPRALERFKREFRALRDLHHVNLTRLDALFEHEGSWYIAMEQVEGDDLLTYARRGGALDRGRIVHALAGASAGLCALHDAGWVHRDVRPESVRVTADGRVVLLEYGLLARAEDADEAGAVGDSAYAAPEQQRGSLPAPAADVYALGACLRDALRGAVGGPPAEVAADGSDELVALAAAMLSANPAARPDMRSVRAALSRERRQRDVRGATGERVEASGRFTGRDAELAKLAAAYEGTAQAGLTVVLIEGDSGIGKSALVDAFVHTREAEPGRLWVLRGRCYESEQVAFKAFDGAVDQLAHALRELPAPICEELLPKRAALLGQLFPVLNTVPVIAQAPNKNLPPDPAIRRRAAIDCFCELLVRLARSISLIVVIDDLQWADAESLRLLGHLRARPRELPALVVCTLRPGEELASEVARELAGLRSAAGVEAITLTGLAREAAERLASELHGAPLSPERSSVLLAESKGHPLFLRELIEHERSGPLGQPVLTLEVALMSRICSFDADAQRLLSLVALADKPLGAHVFARAMGADELPREVLVELIDQRLLRRAGSDALAAYHDQVRQAALGLLDPAGRRALAAKLAAALARERRAEPADCARLWDEAGEPARAGSAYEAAGEAALEKLAFSAAAGHFGRALALLAAAPSSSPAREEQRRSLEARRGDALARAGRSREAARAFQAAARGAAGDRQVTLQVLAAQHLIQAAEVAEGTAAARELLRGLGMPLPRSTRGALLELAVGRAVSRLAGGRGARRAGRASARKDMQLRAVSALGLPLAWIDPLGSAVLGVRYLRMASMVGDPAHLARALVDRARALGLRDATDTGADGLLSRAQAIAAPHQDPSLAATVAFGRGFVASYRWQLDRAIEWLEEAQLIVSERCADQPWLLTNIRTALGAVWANRAEYTRLREDARRWLDEARDRGDEFALTMLNGVGHGFLLSLMDDEPGEIERATSRALARWPAEPFSFAHLGELLARSYQLLYQGGDAARAWYERELPRLSRAFMLQHGMGKGVFLSLHALALLSSMRGAGRTEAAGLARRIARLVDELARVRSAYAEQTAPFLAAQLALLEGRAEHALGVAREVQRRAQETGFVMHAHRALYLCAALEPAARRVTSRALFDLYARQGFVRPERMFAAWCPAVEPLP